MVMYTSIEFCMLPKTSDTEEDQNTPSENIPVDTEENEQEIINEESSQSECGMIGLRQEGKYCSLNKTLEDQKETEIFCENNFECKSNVCVDSQCVSGSLIWRIINWFKNLFG